mmetsp:Transcript_82714/g.151648  ORF Transcript_82714/g.151648 Transcript_82714/m.151648 type:complete len:244 (-) Transcript_82714:389-1120(-)
MPWDLLHLRHWHLLEDFYDLGAWNFHNLLLPGDDRHFNRALLNIDDRLGHLLLHLLNLRQWNLPDEFDVLCLWHFYQSLLRQCHWHLHNLLNSLIDWLGYLFRDFLVIDTRYLCDRPLTSYLWHLDHLLNDGSHRDLLDLLDTSDLRHIDPDLLHVVCENLVYLPFNLDLRSYDLFDLLLHDDFRNFQNLLLHLYLRHLNNFVDHLHLRHLHHLNLWLHHSLLDDRLPSDDLFLYSLCTHLFP